MDRRSSASRGLCARPGGAAGVRRWRISAARGGIPTPTTSSACGGSTGRAGGGWNRWTTNLGCRLTPPFGLPWRRHPTREAVVAGRLPSCGRRCCPSLSFWWPPVQEPCSRPRGGRGSSRVGHRGWPSTSSMPDDSHLVLPCQPQSWRCPCYGSWAVLFFPGSFDADGVLVRALGEPHRGCRVMSPPGPTAFVEPRSRSGNDTGVQGLSWWFGVHAARVGSGAGPTVDARSAFVDHTCPRSSHRARRRRRGRRL